MQSLCFHHLSLLVEFRHYSSSDTVRCSLIYLGPHRPLSVANFQSLPLPLGSFRIRNYYYIFMTALLTFGQVRSYCTTLRKTIMKQAI